MGTFTFWHEADRDGTSQDYRLGQPAATLTSWPTPPLHFSSTSSPGRLVPPQPWVFHGVLPPAHGRGTVSQLLGVGRAVSKPAGLQCLQSWLVPAPLTPGCLTKIAAMERGLLTFFFSFSFSFFFSSCAQTSPDLLTRLWHIILQMWHRSPGCKIYPAWQLVVLCNLHQLTETTVRYY